MDKKTYPEFLYHYTSLESFNSIVTTKQLWASNILYLNDSQEIKGAIEAILYYIEEFADSAPNKYSDLIKEMGYLLNEKYKEGVGKDIYNSNHEDIFVCSFSSKPDMLNQWRGYCPESKGVCICFGYTNELHEFLIQNNFSLVHCEYYSSNKYPKCIKDFIKSIILEFDQLSKIEKSPKNVDRKSGV